MPNSPPPILARSEPDVPPPGGAPVPDALASSSHDAASLRQELARAQAELAAANGLMRATLESTADGVLVTGNDGRVIAFNQKFLQIWHFEAHQVAGAHHLDLVRLARPRLRAPDDAAGRVATIYTAPATDEAGDLVEMADGRTIERFCSMQHVDGRAVGRVWSYRDATARHAAEQALRDEAGVLQFLNRTGAAIAGTLDIAPLLQTVIDAATPVSGAAFGAFLYHVVADASVAAGELGAVAPASLLGPMGVPLVAFAGVTPPPHELFDPQRLAAVFGAAWQGDAPVRCADVTATARYAATARWFGLEQGEAPLRSFLAVPVTLRNGATVGGLFLGHPDAGVFSERTERIVVGIAAHAAIALDNARLVEHMRRDAQERERLVAAERAARGESARAARIKDEFLATLSHELRTPLTAILGWAKVLMLRRADEGTNQRGLEAIERNASAQAALIENLLDMSRIVSGQVQLEVRPTDVARVVAEAVAAARPAAAAKRQSLACRVDPGVGLVAGDVARLGQMLGNLLSNAIRFTPEGGRVEVDARRVGDEVEIAVSDTGQGIAPDFVAHVFDHFRQADSSTTRRHGGLGLGLAVVRQLAALHGGAVGASSAGVGQGARFTVRLPRGVACPLPSPHAGPAPAAFRSFEDVDLRGLRLLVVDDEDDARELIARLLCECGATVAQAANAADALREFRRSPPDVLLSDIGMPGRDGYELVREIRGLDAAHGGQVPAVALTAFVRPEDRAQAMLAGFQAHVGKPIRPDELVAAVERLAPAR